MCVADAQAAPGETAAAAVLERAPNRGRHNACAAANIQHIAVFVVDHDAAGVARERLHVSAESFESRRRARLTGIDARAQRFRVRVHLLSQCAQLRKPLPQPPHWSTSASVPSNLSVAACKCAASSALLSPGRSSSEA
jgi:hypothetical protein